LDELAGPCRLRITTNYSNPFNPSDPFSLSDHFDHFDHTLAILNSCHIHFAIGFVGFIGCHNHFAISFIGCTSCFGFGIGQWAYS
jgi:hypothetical protein